MYWLRSILYAAPLLLVFGGIWLFEKVSALELSPETGAMVCAIREPVGYLDPLVPSTGITGEITDLIFDPLLIRDEELHLRPHLLKSWTSQTVVTVRCSSEEAAGESEAKLRSGEYLPERMEMLALDRAGSVLTAVFRGMETGMEERLVAKFDPGNLGDYLLVRVSLKHSVQDSFEAFLKGSVEKTQVRMIEYVGERQVNLFVRGETDLFLRELNLYYESNRSLDPLIEVRGERCYTSAREMVMELREGVRWHDGHAFSSEDVLFSFNELTRPDSPLPLAASFAFVGSLKTLSPLRLQVECREVPATMMESWEKLPVLPAHLLRTLSDATALAAFFTNPVGTGPYQLAARRPDGGVELVANESYFRGAPLEKELGYRLFDSFESILLALRSGTVEVIEPDERFTDWSRRSPGLVTPLRAEPRIQHFVAWNLERGPLKRQPVRLALAKAVNLTEVLRDTSTGFQEPVTGLFRHGIPYCDSRMTLPLYDLRGAENLLDAEGYHRNESEGTRTDDTGAPLTFTLAVNGANAEHRRLAGALAEQWAGIGVTVEVQEMDWSELLSGRLLRRDFDAVLLSWEIPFERDRYRVWHSAEARPGGGNVSGLRNQVVDGLLEQLRREEDPARVKTVTARLQDSIADLQPCFFICDSGRLLTLRRDGIEIVRPEGMEVGVRSVLPLTLGKSGLEGSRPWWVRRPTATEPVSGATVTE